MFREAGSVQVLTGVAGATIALLRSLDKGRSRTAAQAGLSGSEVRVLSRIAEAGQITPKLMVEFTDLSPSALTAIIDRLVDRGIVQRVVNPKDRRSLFLELTASGLDLMTDLYDAFRRLMEESLRAIPSSEHDQFELQLLALASSLDDQIEGAAAHRTSTPESARTAASPVSK